MATARARLSQRLVSLVEAAFVFALVIGGGNAAAQSRSATPNEMASLVPSSWQVAPRATLAVTGFSFGRERKDWRFLLQETTTSGKPAALKLEVVEWNAERVTLRVPDGGRAGARLYLVLVDSEGRLLARSAKPITLAPAAAAGTDAAKLSRTVPTPSDLTGKTDTKDTPGQQASKGEAARSDKPPDGRQPDTGKEATASGQSSKSKVGSTGGASASRSTDQERVEDSKSTQTGTGSGAQDVRTGSVAPGGQASSPTGVDEEPFGKVVQRSRAAGQAEMIEPYPADARHRGQVRRVALVLQGGGALGAFQVGVLKNLYARGIDPVIITGTSVGALNAAKLAEGRGAEGVAELESLWHSLDGNRSIYVENPQFSDVGQDTLDEWKGWLTDLAVHFVFGGPALLPALADRPSIAGTIDEAMTDVDAIESVNLQDPLIDRVEEHISPTRIACSGIKLRMASVTRDRGDVRFVTELGDVETEDGQLVRIGRLDLDFLSREREQDDPCPVADDVAVNRGDCMTAPNPSDGVLASSAIPMFFKPWLMEGAEYYWDGAVKENSPVRKALELGATDVVVALTGTAPWTHEPSLGPSSYALVVERLHQIDNPEGFTGKRGDYRAEVKVGDGDWMASTFREDDPDIFPRWTFHPVNGDIRLRVWDEEENPDHCDVAPADGRFDLLFHLDGENITGDLRGQVGDLLHARGSGDGNDVEVWLRIVGSSGGQSGYLGGSQLLSITPLRRALRLLGQMTAEVGEGDLDVLDTLDALHEVAQEVGQAAVLRGVRSFPLPRDIMGQAYAIPTYTVVDAPLVIGDVVDFDPSLIEVNMEIGELAAKYTRVDFLDAAPASFDVDGDYVNPTQNPDLSDDQLDGMKRDAILELLGERIEALRELASTDPTLPPGSDRWDVNRRKQFLQGHARMQQRAQQWLRVLEKEHEGLQERPIYPARRSMRSGRIEDLEAIGLPDPTECLEELDRILSPPPISECQAIANRIAALEQRLTRAQERLADASPAAKAQLLAMIERLDEELDSAREDYERQCGR